MTTYYQAQVLEVSEVRAGSEVTQDYAINATVLSLYDVTDFDEEGGQVEIEGVVYSYYTSSEEDDSITLTSGLTAAITADTEVYLYPASIEKEAMIQVDDEDAVMVRVPLSLYDALTPNVRDDRDQESVLVYNDGGDWVIHDVVGQAVTRSGEYLDPATVPPSPTATDGTPPPDAPVLTAIGGVEALFLSWTSAGGSDLVTYDIYVDTATPVAQDAAHHEGMTEATVATIGKGAGTYHAVVVPRDADGVGMASNEATDDVVARFDDTAMQQRIDANQAAVNARPRVIFATAQPTGLAADEKVIWYDTDNGYSASYWDGTAWSPYSLGTGAIAPNAVTSALIADAAVTATEIGSAAVVAGKLAAAAVDSTVLASGSVIAGKIAADAVTAAELAAGAVSVSELAANAVTAAALSANAVTTAKIAADAVTAAQIATAAIGSSELGAGAVTSAAIAANAVTTSAIVADAITAAQIAMGAIGSSELAANAVTSAAIAADAVTASQIAVGAVTSSELGASAVTSAAIAANAVTTADIAADAVTAGQIAAGAVASSELAAGAVTSAAVAADAITAAAIAVGAIGSSELGTGAVTSAAIAANAVTTAAIAADAITASQIAAGAVAASELSANAVTTAAIAADAITAAQIAVGAVGSSELGTGAVTSAAIAANAVTTSAIVADAITAAQIAMNAVGSSEIAAGAIIAGKITAGTIVSGDIATGTITAGNIAAGTITATQLAAGSVIAGKIAANAITATELAANAVTAVKIAAGTITGDKVAANTIATSKLLIASLDNLVADPTFLTALGTGGAWPANAGWAIVAATGESGGNGLQVTNDTTSQTINNIPVDFPIEGGSSFHVFARVKQSTAIPANGLRMQLRFKNAAGTITNIYTAAPATTALDTWVTLSGMVTAPADAVALAFFLRSEAANSTGVATWSQVAVTRAAGGELIVDGAVTANSLAAGSVTAAKIVAGTITSTEIAAGTITASDIAALTITSSEIAAGAIVAGKVAANTITATELAANSITAVKIAAGTITGDKVAANSITTGKLVITNFDNILNDPGFMLPLGSGADYGWSNGTGLSIVVNGNRRGTGNTLQFAPNASATVNAINQPAWSWDIENGASFRLRAAIYSDLALPAAGLNLRFRCYASDGTYVDKVVSSPALAAATWTDVSGIITVPTDKTYTKGGFYLSAPAHSTQTIQVAEVAITRAAGGELIVDGAVTANSLAAGSVTAAKIVAGTITSTEIAAGTITASDIAALAITSSEIAAGAVVAGKVAANAITATELAAGSITAGDMVAGTITSAQIAAGTIAASNIAADTIGAGQIAANAITSSEIAAGAIVAGKITAGTIVTADIATDTITAGNIAALAITSSEIAAGAVVAGKVAADAITATELAAGSVTSAEITAGAVTAGAIAAGAVTAGKIAANAVTATELAAGAVVAGKIAAGVITSTEVAAGAITANKLNVIMGGGNLISNSRADNGTVGWTAYRTSIQALAEYGRSGINSWRVTATDTTGAQYIYRQGVTSQDPPKVSEGQTYTQSVWVRNNAAADRSFSLEFRSGAGTEVNYQGTAGVTIPAGQWRRVTGTVTMPAGVTETGFSLIRQPAGAAGETWNVTDWQLEEGDVATAYAPKTDEILPGSVVASMVATSTLTATQIAADTIGASNIAANAITSSELAAGAVTAGKITAGTIVAADISSGTITTTQIASGTITAGNISASTITATQIAASTITSALIAANTIVAADIAGGTITATQVATDTLTAGNIAAGAITVSEIGAGAVNASKIAAGTITANEIASGTITATQIAAGTISATNIAAGAIDASKLTATAIDGKTITGSTLQTASGGKRIVISTDGTVSVYSGISGDPSFGTESAAGGFSAGNFSAAVSMRVSGPATNNYPEQAYFELQSNVAGQSAAVFFTKLDAQRTAVFRGVVDHNANVQMNGYQINMGGGNVINVGTIGGPGTNLNVTDNVIFDSLKDGGSSNSSTGTKYVRANPAGRLYSSTTAPSSRAIKDKIEDLDLPWDSLLQLRPRSFVYKAAPDQIRVGVIAEEAHDLGLNRLVGYEDHEDPEKPTGFDYDGLTVALLKIIQDQDKRIIALEGKVEGLTKKAA